jgi:hypothetical protein
MDSVVSAIAVGDINGDGNVDIVSNTIVAKVDVL